MKVTQKLGLAADDPHNIDENILPYLSHQWRSSCRGISRDLVTGGKISVSEHVQYAVHISYRRVEEVNSGVGIQVEGSNI